MGRHAGSEGRDVERNFPGMGGIPEDDRQQPQKCQHAASERVEEKLHGSLPPLIVAPDTDQEKERHEREFEEHVEEDHIACSKNSQHRRLEQEQQHVEADRLLLNRLPTHQHRRQREEG